MGSSPIAFFGYLILGMGPGTVFFLFFIAQKSFLVLLSLFRCVVCACACVCPGVGGGGQV